MLLGLGPCFTLPLLYNTSFLPSVSLQKYSTVQCSTVLYSTCIVRIKKSLKILACGNGSGKNFGQRQATP